MFGFDLAGVEAENPAKRHTRAFQHILNHNINCTVHAGEDWGPDSIHQALHYLNAHRVSHATRLLEDPALKDFSGRVSDSGEGRWTIKAAIDEGVPVPVLTTALYERFSSRGEADYQDKLLSAMRFQFGGHVEKTAK